MNPLFILLLIILVILLACLIGLYSSPLLINCNKFGGTIQYKKNGGCVETHCPCFAFITEIKNTHLGDTCLLCGHKQGTHIDVSASEGDNNTIGLIHNDNLILLFDNNNIKYKIELLTYVIFYKFIPFGSKFPEKVVSHIYQGIELIDVLISKLNFTFNDINGLLYFDEKNINQYIPLLQRGDIISPYSLYLESEYISYILNKVPCDILYHNWYSIISENVYFLKEKEKTSINRLFRLIKAEIKLYLHYKLKILIPNFWYKIQNKFFSDLYDYLISTINTISMFIYIFINNSENYDILEFFFNNTQYDLIKMHSIKRHYWRIYSSRLQQDIENFHPIMHQLKYFECADENYDVFKSKLIEEISKIHYFDNYDKNNTNGIISVFKLYYIIPTIIKRLDINFNDMNIGDIIMFLENNINLYVHNEEAISYIHEILDICNLTNLVLPGKISTISGKQELPQHITLSNLFKICIDNKDRILLNKILNMLQINHINWELVDFNNQINCNPIEATDNTYWFIRYVYYYILRENIPSISKNNNLWLFEYIYEKSPQSFNIDELKFAISKCNFSKSEISKINKNIDFYIGYCITKYSTYIDTKKEFSELQLSTNYNHLSEFQIGDIIEIKTKNNEESLLNFSVIAYANEILKSLNKYQTTEQNFAFIGDDNNFRDKFLNNLALIVVDIDNEKQTYKCILLYPQLFAAFKKHQQLKDQINSSASHAVFGGLTEEDIAQLRLENPNITEEELKELKKNDLSQKLKPKFETIIEYVESTKGVYNILKSLRDEYNKLEKFYTVIQFFDIPFDNAQIWKPMVIKGFADEFANLAPYEHLTKFYSHAHGNTIDSLFSKKSIKINLENNEYVVMSCNPFIPVTTSMGLIHEDIKFKFNNNNNFEEQLKLLYSSMNGAINTDRNTQSSRNNYCVFSKRCPNIHLQYYDHNENERFKDINDTLMNIYQFPMKFKSKTIRELIERASRAGHPINDTTQEIKNLTIEDNNLLSYLFGTLINDYSNTNIFSLFGFSTKKNITPESNTIQETYLANVNKLYEYLKASDELDTYSNNYGKVNSTLEDEIIKIREYKKNKCTQLGIPYDGFLLFVLSCRSYE